MLYICWSYHHILIAIERVLSKKQDADIIVVFRNGNPDPAILDRIVSKKVFKNVYSIQEQECNWEISKKKVITYFYARYIGMRKHFDFYFPVDLSEYKEIYTFYDSSVIGAYLNAKKIPYHIIEDAKKAYTTDVLKRVEISTRKLIYEPNLLIRILKKIGYIIPVFGESKHCIDIEVDSDENLYRTKYNKDKFVVIPTKNYEKALSQNDIRNIIEIFSNGLDIDIAKKYLLILTEPLKANGVVDSYDDQKKVYQYLLEELDDSPNIIMIKPHPRDEFDYSSIIENKRVVLLDKKFPSEILSLIPDECFEHFFTIASSAIYSFPKEKSTIKGFEYIKTIL